MIYYKLNNPKCTPKQGSKQAAGIDLRADIKDTYIEAGKVYSIYVGCAFEIPIGWVGKIYPRSSFGKYGMRIMNTTPIIDSDFRDVPRIDCTFDKSFWLEAHERFCQMVVVPHYPTDQYVEADELAATDRGAGGFGSTGKQ